ncbi:MAG TPA: NAD(P)H-dependent glycerol-3-phosphate dehydrogenase [Candidatus Hydrothermia bacterium]|nr:NAD(P)-dependent glycerol-3-phosphate dehydrogenase [Candidatus Hydrothermia bacterium]MDD5572482.1 NAD(P)-dependent glycerol-3-phosphate dehydrogenase [Candidatus Hydrothermia bacterium]HRD22648.1 NAD(P)H-dependent glycerol-3-phosphate dehydrogenase [Candidatus Hydrothermia bacterium]
MKNIGIIGSGSWGITLGILLTEKGHHLKILCRREEKKVELDQKRMDFKRLGEIKIPREIVFTIDPDELKDSEYVVFAVPSHTLRMYLNKVKSSLRTDKLISVIKGIEAHSFKAPSEIIEEYFPSSQIAVLTGPSISREVLRKIPTSVVVASRVETFAVEVQMLFHTNYFRVYYTSDVKGCELGAAVKNVIAIAAGVLDGLGYGANTKGALIVRGAREIMKLGEKMGANPLTISGLSGIGDLITTCFSPYSRNRIVGEQIALGKDSDEVLAEMEMVAEGINTSHVIKELAANIGIEMPVVECVHGILNGELTPLEAVDLILNRPPKPEFY